MFVFPCSLIFVHVCLRIFMYFHGLSWALMDCHGFSIFFNGIVSPKKHRDWTSENHWGSSCCPGHMVHDRGKNATGRIWHLKDDQIESKSNVVQVSQELIPNHNQTSGKLEHFSVAANHPTWSGDWFSSPASAHLIPWKQLTMSVSVGKTSEKIVLVNNFM